MEGWRGPSVLTAEDGGGEFDGLGFRGSQFRRYWEFKSFLGLTEKNNSIVRV